MKGRFPGILPAALAVLLIACAAGWLATRDVSPVRATKKPSTAAVRISKVDERLLETARELASLADTHAEQALATEAVRLSNQEVDQDFATSIREAAAIVPPASGPLHDLAQRVAAAKEHIAADQQRIAKLTAKGSNLDLAHAQLTLDQDELDDAEQDLAQAGGDEHANLERARQALQGTRQAPVPLAKLSAAGPPETLSEQIRLWFSLESRLDQVQAARQEADKKASTLSLEHKQLEGKLVSAPPAASDDDDNSDEEDTSTAVAQLRGLSDMRKTLADLDKRTDICQELSAGYQQWMTILAGRRRTLLHGLLESFGVILIIVLAATAVKSGLSRVLGRDADKRRNHQLQIIIRIAVHAVAAILILLVIFGAPTQTPTIIGLAGAGLTVVMKDFIVAFFGWFVLMGRNGLRLGDWVEINGVGGEVIELGVLKTVLLEMGNWTNSGHPTGRRVSFMNGFAIEGHYFNFSTAGQWLWDELQVTVPGNEPYQLAEQIRQVVERETEAEAKLAEQDWERVTHQYGTRAFSARPAADLRPGPNGLLVNVRYITRAPLRYEVKSRLFQAIVELMHKPDKVAAV